MSASTAPIAPGWCPPSTSRTSSVSSAISLCSSSVSISSASMVRRLAVNAIITSLVNKTLLHTQRRVMPCMSDRIDRRQNRLDAHAIFHAIPHHRAERPLVRCFRCHSLARRTQEHITRREIHILPGNRDGVPPHLHYPLGISTTLDMFHPLVLVQR